MDRAGAHPRVYRITLGWRLFLYAGGGLLALGGAAAIYFGAAQVHTATAMAAAVAGGVLFTLLGALLVVDTARSRVVLTADTIALHGAHPPRRLRRDEIAGVRIISAGAFATLVLVPHPPRRPLKLPLIIHTDDELTAWLDPFPNLDAVERERATAELATFGPDARARARRFARLANATAIAALPWGILYPRPYALVITVLVGLPLVTLAALALWPRLFRLEGRRNQPHPQLTLAFIAPGMVLAFRALSDFQLVDWRLFIAPVVTAGLLFTLLALVLDPDLRRRTGLALVILPFATIYAYGALGVVNGLAERSPGRSETAHVVAKYVSQGKQTTHHLTLAGLTSTDRDTDARVSRALYTRVAPGDDIGVIVHRGALGVPWFSLEDH